jgi:hypothetical protein
LNQGLYQLSYSHLATGQNECVVVGRADHLDGLIDLELVGLVVVVEPLNLAVLGGHQLQIRTGAPQRLPRPSQLNLLNHCQSQETQSSSL